MPAKVMLLAVGLGVGGTETHILELASRMDRSRFEVTVCTLKPGGAVADELKARGVRVISLDGSGKWDLRVMVRLYKLLRAERPDLRVVFMSGYTDEEILRRGVSDGAMAFLPKPFRAADLARVVREALDAGSGSAS